MFDEFEVVMLKMLFFQFVTLPVGEERSQLVTVLETMLKLTQNEKQTLSVIAKGSALLYFFCRACLLSEIYEQFFFPGQRLDQKAASGWTSYLGW